MNPLLSIIVPTLNRRALAEEALRSALGPLPFSCELILSDNASTDSTPGLAAAFPAVKYIRRPTLVPMAAHWNLCVAECQGKYVKILCDDDILLPGALARELSALEADPGLALCASARIEVSADGKTPVALKRWSEQPVRLAGEDLFFQMLLKENIVGPPTSVTFRKEAFSSFRESYVYAADWAAWVTLADEGAFQFLPEPGSHFRLHPENLTISHVEEGTDFIEVQRLRRECLRRLRGWSYAVGAFAYAWIYAYRLGRRILRHLTRLEFMKLVRFCGRVFF